MKLWALQLFQLLQHLALAPLLAAPAHVRDARDPTPWPPPRRARGQPRPLSSFMKTLLHVPRPREAERQRGGVERVDRCLPPPSVKDGDQLVVG